MIKIDCSALLENSTLAQWKCAGFLKAIGSNVIYSHGRHGTNILAFMGKVQKEHFGE